MLFLFSVGLHAQDKCNVEVKLLLPSAEAQDAIVALKAKKETTSRIYFFDTEALELLSEGIIIRLRQAAGSELTVKLRSPTGKKSSPPSEKSEDFKCEVDQTGEGAATSYSIRKRYVSEEIPQGGNEVSILLSPEQRKFLKDAQISIDWTRVRRIAEVTSIAWQPQGQPQSRQTRVGTLGMARRQVTGTLNEGSTGSRPVHLRTIEKAYGD